MKIPTEKQCFSLMCTMKMMDHIVVHSMQVCRVASFLAEQLNPAQDRLNHDLIRAAALLHDITKTRSFKTEENHAVTGGQYLAEQGYPEVGELVRQHVRLDAYPDTVIIGEAQIINYADKRVLHDRIVELDERLDYIVERYGKAPEILERINHLWGKTLAIEDEIFSDLSISPRDLNRLLNAEDPSADFPVYRRLCNS